MDAMSLSCRTGGRTDMGTVPCCACLAMFVHGCWETSFCPLLRLCTRGGVVWQRVPPAPRPPVLAADRCLVSVRRTWSRGSWSRGNFLTLPKHNLPWPDLQCLFRVHGFSGGAPGQPTRFPSSASALVRVLLSSPRYDKGMYNARCLGKVLSKLNQF
jgi:hypothetical protein